MVRWGGTGPLGYRASAQESRVRRKGSRRGRRCSGGDSGETRRADLRLFPGEAEFESGLRWWSTTVTSESEWMSGTGDEKAESTGVIAMMAMAMATARARARAAAAENEVEVRTDDPTGSFTFI
jgi:hypothetical protein